MVILCNKCGHDANEHALFNASGCTIVKFNGNFNKKCKCMLAQSDVLYQAIQSLETDLIQACRVADERQGIIDRLKNVIQKIAVETKRSKLTNPIIQILIELLENEFHDG